MAVLTSWPTPPTFGAPRGSDLVIHAGLYAVFAYLILRAAQDAKPSLKSMLLTVVALAGWAGLDEAHQIFIAGRGASVADWLADLTGVCIGVLARHLRTPSSQAQAT